jgi:tetratricopeptide (TPR) repeat protein
VATNKDKLIAGAQKLVEKSQFEKAIKEYLKVVADDDKDVRIWLKIGDLYAKLGKKSEAAETYAKVAQFYSDQGFYLKAVAVYKQILKIEPRLVDVNHKLAELYKQLGLLSDAMQQYEAVAAFYHREGKTRDALAALKQIVELDPETVANRIKLAELYSKESMQREAIDEFSKAAEQLRQAGRVDDFMKVAERLLFHSPDNRPVTKELAGLYIEKGDPRRALPKLQVCFKADPRDTDVLSLLAKAFEALDQRSKSVSVLKELARILGENGDTRGRDATWRKILQLAPGDADAEAALSNPGRARPPSQPSIDEALNSPRGAGGARQAGQFDGRAAGGDERVGAHAHRRRRRRRTRLGEAVGAEEADRRCADARLSVERRR